MDIQAMVTGALLAAGCFFLVVAAVGIIRFPDFYSRIHPAGKSDTLGQLLVLMGLMIHEGLSFVSIKLLIIAAFILIATPTATHTIAKAAYLAGLPPWVRSPGRKT